LCTSQVINSHVRAFVWLDTLTDIVFSLSSFTLNVQFYPGQFYPGISGAPTAY
jgi:hypothetical protein